MKIKVVIFVYLYLNLNLIPIFNTGNYVLHSRIPFFIVISTSEVLKLLQAWFLFEKYAGAEA